MVALDSFGKRGADGVHFSPVRGIYRSLDNDVEESTTVTGVVTATTDCVP